MKRDAFALLTHLSRVQTALEAAPAVKMGGLAGGAFLELDGVLVTLNKQRLAAQKNYARLSRDFGFDDAMVEAAAEQLNAVEQMYMARLTLLRKRRESSDVVRKAKQRLAQRREAIAQQKSLEEAQHMRDTQMEAQRKKRNSDFWFMLMMLMIWQSFKPYAPPAPRLVLQ